MGDNKRIKQNKMNNQKRSGNAPFRIIPAGNEGKMTNSINNKRPAMDKSEPFDFDPSFEPAPRK